MRRYPTEHVGLPGWAACIAILDGSGIPDAAAEKLRLLRRWQCRAIRSAAGDLRTLWADYADPAPPLLADFFVAPAPEGSALNVALGLPVGGEAWFYSGDWTAPARYPITPGIEGYAWRK